MQGIQQAGIRSLLTLTGDRLEVPPHFERVVGYAGSCRYVSFHVAAHSALVVEDGESVQVGHHGPLAVWSGHLAVWPALTGAGVNWAGREALGDPEHRIVLDRTERRLYAGLAADVRTLLDEAVPVGASQRVFNQSGAAGSSEAAEVGGNQTTRAALLDWLDARRLPCPSCLTTHAAGDFGASIARGAAEESSHSGDVTPTCPSCGEPFYGRPLLALLARIVPHDEAAPLPVGIPGDTSSLAVLPTLLRP